MRIKYLLLGVLYAFPSCGLHSQGLNTENYKKYSYLVQAMDSTYKTGNVELMGTAFMISYKNQNYLLTNYHIVTAKNALTGTFTVDAGFQPKNLLVAFHIKNSKNRVLVNYNLMGAMGEPRYFTLMSDFPKYFDIAALPIGPLPDSFETNLITPDFFDSASTAFWPNKHIISVGFPKGTTDSSGYGLIFEALTLMPPGGKSYYLFYDTITEHGTSGSPIYEVDEGGNMKILGIDCEGPSLADPVFTYGGAGIYFKYVLKVINQSQL